MAANDEQQRSGTRPSENIGSDARNMETGAGASVTVRDESEQQGADVVDPIAELERLRDRVLPILQAARQEYIGRVRTGYPMIVDNVRRGGIFGMHLDPGYGVFFMTDGERLFAELHFTSLRWDTLSAANAEKFAGKPVIEQYDIDSSWSEREARNLFAELLSKWNYQELRIYRTDS